MRCIPLALLVSTGCVHAPPTRPPGSESGVPGYVTARKVFVGISTVAGARELVATAVSFTGLPVSWLLSDPACIITGSIKSIADLTVDVLGSAPDLPGVPAHAWDLSTCGSVFGPVDIPPGTYLIADSALSIAEGGLLLGGVFERDPVGFGVGCGMLEWGRVSIPATLGKMETEGLGGGIVDHPAQSFDATSCRDALLRRDRAIRDGALGIDPVAYDAAVTSVAVDAMAARQ